MYYLGAFSYPLTCLHLNSLSSVKASPLHTDTLDTRVLARSCCSVQVQFSMTLLLTNTRKGRYFVFACYGEQQQQKGHRSTALLRKFDMHFCIFFSCISVSRLPVLDMKPLKMERFQTKPIVHFTILYSGYFFDRYHFLLAN